MYVQSPTADAKRIVHAVLTDQLAHFAPSLYVRLTGQTGRGAEEQSPRQIADYFRTCFDEYFPIQNVAPRDIGSFLAGKRLLEYGPGDIPGVALLMIAHGAEQVTCVDRFPLVSASPKNIAVLQCLLDGLDGTMRARAESCFRDSGNPSSGLAEQRIRYLVRPSGLSGLKQEIDLIISRAVLEHVDNLSATFADMHSALKPNGIAVHQVDLKSHGLHRRNPLDFLTWPPRLWSWMYGHKGVPNRWRVDRYRQVLAETGMKALLLQPTLLADRRDMEEVRPHLALPFRDIADEDLAWLGFWLVCCKADEQG